jgi:hypothetical protein
MSPLASPFGGKVEKDKVVVETLMIYKDKSLGSNYRSLSKYKKK